METPGDDMGIAGEIAEIRNAILSSLGFIRGIANNKMTEASALILIAQEMNRADKSLLSLEKKLFSKEVDT